MERPQAEKDLAQRNRELLLLNRVEHLFGSTLELEQVLKIVLVEMRHLFDIIATSFWRVLETGDLVCQQADGLGSDRVIGWRLTPGRGIAGWVAQHGEPLLVTDTRQEQRHFKGIDLKMDLEIRSILSMPLWIKGEVIAVFNLVDTEVNRFSQADLTLLEPIAAAAARAIENARLYTAVQQANDALEAKVEARTAELAEANRNLQAEIGRRQQQQAEKERLFEVVRQQSEQLRALTHLLLEAQQKHRQGLAETLHDQVEQDLSLLQVNLSLVRQILAGALDNTQAIELAGEHLHNALHILARTRQSTRQVASNLDQAASEHAVLLQSPLLNLSSREHEVLQLLVEGKSNADIATILTLSKTTVSTYRKRIMQKLNIDDLPTLIKFALQHHLIPGNI